MSEANTFASNASAPETNTELEISSGELAANEAETLAGGLPQLGWPGPPGGQTHGSGNHNQCVAE